MRFRNYDNLRLFNIVARHMSLTAAAEELHLTKGAVSYQIARLEEELGFSVFMRRHRGIDLTDKGRRLWHVSQAAFNALEREISVLRETDPSRITIGLSTYLASRWLSPRLMGFLSEHPKIALRLQPLVELIDLRGTTIDMVIRWGRGEWTDLTNELLFACPAFPIVGSYYANRIDELGLQATLPELPLLQDREGSVAWYDWHQAAGLPYVSTRNDLIIPDPNVRVQAVIDGQGAALGDHLIAQELSGGRLFRTSQVELTQYGYHLAYPAEALENPAIKAFRDWILNAAEEHVSLC
ncbi:LysR substrate-binding domain-containing protein [Pontibaca salina]|uniref:LysR family transcriptional regulator n=1 Tax=Pontibaca salina TaxID=2795731 RepID=A0A934HVP3_9RHOB|nr:LysR substrate-binding domain-containing protein [Pontibaca salina]MBI6630384.1 LysR family transcriptional regulator [Pontibaca salina]